MGISIIGEQVICAKEWKISNLFGPVGSLESNPDRPLTFNDLQDLDVSELRSLNNYINSIFRTRNKIYSSKNNLFYYDYV